jgi:hypothetical protein
MLPHFCRLTVLYDGPSRLSTPVGIAHFHRLEAQTATAAENVALSAAENVALRGDEPQDVWAPVGDVGVPPHPGTKPSERASEPVT